MGNNDTWLAKLREPALEPELSICDCHHHLWGYRDHPAATRYLLDDLLADIDDGGHNIVSTVFVDSHAMYRADSDRALAPIGEVEFANGVAAICASGLFGKTQVAAGIISHADMTLGSAAGGALDALTRAAPARFRGIRHSAAWDADEGLPKHRHVKGPHLLLDETFRAGIAEVARRGLVYECYLWHPQLPELTDLARAFPDLTIICNHCGGPLGAESYRGKRDAVMAGWRASMAELAKCENVIVKLGGVNMVVNGHDWEKRERPPSSDEMVAAAGPYIEQSIELFGVERAMFESNYPAERTTAGYGEVWNFFKKITKGFSADEKVALYHDNAVRVYRLDA
jgi:predicted TIM-barrel fold metal-dependent hydrolase